MPQDIGGYGLTIIGVMWTETLLALLFVSMRLWTRVKIRNAAGWDDYLAVVSWFMLMPYTVACTFAVSDGFGSHAKDLSTEQFVLATRSEIIGQTFCIIGIATSKASVAVFLLRITVVAWHKWTLYFLMLSVSVICFCCALFDFVRCDPVEHVWNPKVEAHCWIGTEGFTALSVTVGVASTLADFVLATLPWFILWNLKMKQKDKILIASSMSLGFFAMICGIVRAIDLQGLTARSDYSYETVGLILWSSTELMVTILTATIPTLRPLYSKIRGYHSSNEAYEMRRNGGHRLKDAVPIALRPNAENIITTTTIGVKTETQSEEYTMQDGNDILCTDTVIVTYGQLGKPVEKRFKDNSWEGCSGDCV
ncbi:hypothetical protein BJ875DRAFT_435271 [Amylocarpus encephaloides]|uniref:Rhodopsin domain-containing protein n=1 Tax=Amylocarpus encephaloides TaxID=45428 RepID=A0A9P8C0U3_9HELO|nr:hypothetical protein BJ875DRAFT_435271 [Amylocarpus encephaloides]